MAAAKGNKNAKGNSGGKAWSESNRKKAETLKGLVMDYAIEVLKRGEPDTKDKLFMTRIRERELVISKILPNAIPRSMEITGDDTRPIPILLKK